MAVTEISTALNVELSTSDVARPRFTPRELRLVKEHAGRTFTQIMADDDSDDRFVVFAWLKLRREGHPLEWADMDDVVISITADTVDPTNGQPATTSPPSAATGE